MSNEKNKLREASPDDNIYKMGYVFGTTKVSDRLKELESMEGSEDDSMSETEKWLTQGMAEAALNQWKK